MVLMKMVLARMFSRLFYDVYLDFVLCRLLKYILLKLFDLLLKFITKIVFKNFNLIISILVIIITMWSYLIIRICFAKGYLIILSRAHLFTFYFVSSLNLFKEKDVCYLIFLRKDHIKLICWEICTRLTVRYFANVSHINRIIKSSIFLFACRFIIVTLEFL